MYKILIVEDEITVRENIAEILHSFQYEVLSARDGKDALVKLSSFQPDLILSDIMMPEMDGYSFYNECKNNPKLEDIPFIFLTAKSQIKDIRTGMASGAEDYITKPFRANDLLNSIAVRIEKKEKSRLRLDKIKDSIAKYIPHELRTPLISILGFSDLVLSEGDTLSREEIIDMVSRINRAGRRLHSLVEKFIIFSDLQLRLYDSNELTQIRNRISANFHDSIKMIVTEKGAYFNRNDDIELELEPVNLKGDDFYTETIVREIVENAFKFSEQGTEVKVSGKFENGFYILKVKDSGIGFSKEIIDKIDSFTQFNKASLQQTGLGLGLQLSKKIAVLLDGKIEILSGIDASTEVVISLPTV
ncbi:MAG: hybrid sensor histidine kinase/response regulator [Melioribacteraceae bacterium]|nr:MAG: hybrid sensor histidine kinase/response regulator [Melioribacteraceae bacterium]